MNFAERQHPQPWDFDAFAVAHSVMTYAREAAGPSLAALVTAWLEEDPEN